MPRTGNRKTRQEDRRQTLLLLSRKQRLDAVQAIDPDQLGIGRRTWANIVDLLTQIEVCTSPDGCFAYAETLAARMRVGAGVSRATLFRASKQARELGLLESFGRVNRQGTQSNEWRVNWHRVSVLAQAAGWEPLPEPAPPPDRRKTETGVAQTETGGSHSETPLIGIVSRQFRPSKTSRPGSPAATDESTSCTSSGDTAAWDTAAVLDEVWHLREKLGKFRSERDWSLAVKAVRLSQTCYSSTWLWGAVEVARGKRRPWAYLHTTLADQAEQLGRRFDRDLARLTNIPAELARPDWESERTQKVREYATRLCEVED